MPDQLTARDLEMAQVALRLRVNELEARANDGDRAAGDLAREYRKASYKFERLAVTASAKGLLKEEGVGA